MDALVVYRSVRTDSASLAARDRHTLSRIAEMDHGILCVDECAGDVLGLGRFHVVPEVDDVAGLALHRRLGGGRPVPLGQGFFAVSLVLPSPSAFIAKSATSLLPEQVLNRAVRGVLGALEVLGVSGYYPGRDLVTANGRTIGALTLEIDESGATLIEMMVAANRSFAEVTSFLDRGDRTGTVPADVVLAEQATSIVQERGRPATLDAFADALCEAYAARLRLTCRRSEADLPATPVDVSWLRAAGLRPELDRRAAARTQLGVLEAHVAVAAGHIVDVRLTGDFIASAATVARIERGLRGVAPERAVVLECVHTAIRGPTDFVLGIRPLDTIADVVLRACGV